MHTRVLPAIDGGQVEHEVQVGLRGAFRSGLGGERHVTVALPWRYRGVTVVLQW
jgi:hypothetical protein